MKKRLVLSLSAIILTSLCTTVFAFNSSDLNQRLRNCTPTKNFNVGGSTYYQISGLTGSVCIYKIIYNSSNKSDLICKVPIEKMPEAASYNPITPQRIRNKYCVMSIRSLGGVRR